MEWNRIMRPKYAWLFVALLMVLSLISNNGVRYLFKIRANMFETTKSIEDINKENAEYEKKISETRDNPKVMEILARTRLGMVKSDETVYRIK
ncbi:MAG: septum formation initiator family protein [Pseudomonadota bacterium]